ncbi:MAG: N-6 DNA methylase [Phycisphaerales bacterium]|nr:N-6 DNA methylase [Phycisphaerales bacterium]
MAKRPTQTPRANSTVLPPEVASRLGSGPEQLRVVGPLVARLLENGWALDQMMFGRHEWRVPRSPSQATLRERAQSYQSNPVDIAVFDAAKHVGKPKHLAFIIECKQPDDDSGISQLDAYLANEPHARLGIWANSAEDAAPAAYVYRMADGSFLSKRKTVAMLPRPHDRLTPDHAHVVWKDLQQPSVEGLKRIVERLLDKVVVSDAQVTRREEQLDQLCSVILLKLESDKQAKTHPQAPPFFRPLATHHDTAEVLRDRFSGFVQIYPEVFTSERDRTLRLDDESLYACAEALGSLKLIDLGISTVSTAFQVLRSEALKQGEGQYFTPQAVIRAGIKLLDIQWDDLVIDPACGTGGFLVETMLYLRRENPGLSESELSRWAQTHIFGIDKDPIGVKLTKAIMQVAGDGSAHTVRGDSVRTQRWATEYPHLSGGKFANGRFTVVVTNPPFGKNLTVSAEDARLAGLAIAKQDGVFADLEIGLLMLERSYQLLRKGGRLGIVLPETYFFSSKYQFVQEWVEGKLRPVVVANVPMDAFQGFCRAKTNFYVFEKVGK